MRGSVLRVGVGVLTVALLAAVVIAGVVVSDAPEARSMDLGSGSAWFASRRARAAVLIDGASGDSIKRVAGALASDQVEVEQDGSSALVVDRAAGTVARIDGATWLPSEAKPVSSRNDASLRVLTAGGVAWAIGQDTTLVQQFDTGDLSVIGEPQTVPNRVSGAAVSRTGTLWVTSPTGEVRSYRDGRPVATSQVQGMRDATLVMAGDDPVLVDRVTHAAHGLDPDSGEVVR